MPPFYQQISIHPPFFDVERAQLFYDDLLTACGKEERLSSLREILEPDGEVKNLILSVMGASPFLRAIMTRQPGMLSDCLLTPVETHLRELCARVQNEVPTAPSQQEAMTLLRRFKQNTALSIALYDLAGVENVEEITAMITRAADCAVQAALSLLFKGAQADGRLALSEGADPVANSGYFVLAMGKHGGGDLNYSSDIDLIIFYDPARMQLAEGVEPAKFFVRLTKNLVTLLNERTMDGYVYRTDLRLRPDPSSTQLAMSVEAGLSYYESFGQNWERSAMIKARVIAGDHEAGADFLEQLSPYIWRKYLDFAAINDIHAMKRQIHAVKGHAEITVRGHNIKLGRGGIREIEFFVTTQQLIAGGRQPALRGRKTLENLQLLADFDWISQQAVIDLTKAWRFLRHVEHRLQMVEDAQTQTMPIDDNELLRIARFSGFETYDEFAATLTGHMEKVQGHYEALFEDQAALTGGEGEGDLVFTGDEHDPATLQSLSQIGFGNPGSVISVVQDWHRGRYVAMRSTRAREALTELTPLLLDALARTGHADSAFIAFDQFLKRLPAGVQLFSLLQANPHLLRLLANIMGTAPRLARILSTRAKLLDVVLDPAFFGTLPSKAELDENFAKVLKGAQDFSELLDRARISGREQAFMIGVRILTDTISPDQAGEAYAHLAASAISHLHEAANAEMAAAHGAFKTGQSCVLAMGKVGGLEMTASSDLDLIVIYDHDEDEDTSSGGGRPLNASPYFNRLTQRLITALSAPTPEGMLYEVDMRLRPSGSAGPVATSLESFALYQRDKAWTWEHMALTRALVVSGPPEIADKVFGIIHEVLCRPRDEAKTAADVIEMRERIFAEKGSTDIWDIKQVRGGLIDLEFTTQYLQLVNAHETPEILDQNTGMALRKLASHGMLDWGDAEQLIDGAFLLHALTQVLRLCHDRGFAPGEAPEGLKNLLAHAGGSPDFAHLERHLKETQARIASLYEKLVAGMVKG